MSIKTKRVPVSQAMTALVREKRRKPKGKMAEEPPVIPCTTKKLNHVLDKWIGNKIFQTISHVQATNIGRKEEFIILQDP